MDVFINRILKFGVFYPKSVISFLLIVTVVFFSALSDLHVEVTAEGMMVKDDPARIFYEQSLSTFGSENVTIVYFEDENLFRRDKLLAIQKAVNKLNASPMVERTVSLFSIRHIRTKDGYTYTNPYLKPVPKTAEALEQVKIQALKNPLVANNLLSDDGKVMAINVFLKTENYQRGFDDKANDLINGVLEPLHDQFTNVFYIGDPYVRVGLTERIQDDQKIFIPMAVLLLVLILTITLKQPKAALIPLLTAGMSIVWILGLMSMLNIPVNVMTSVIPALLVIIGSTEDIHLISEYHIQKKTSKTRQSALELMANNMGLAVLLTFITTYLGFLSIAAGNLELLQQFGLIASTGLLFNFIITLLLVPLLLQVFQLDKSKAFTPNEPLSIFQNISRHALNLTQQHRKLTITGLLLISLVSGFYATQVRVNNNVMDYFSDSSPLKWYAEQLHHNLSGIQTLSIIVSGEENAFLKVENLLRLWELQEFMRDSGYFDATFSFADFVGVVHAGLNDDWTVSALLPQRDEVVEEYMSLLDADAVKSFVSTDYSQTRLMVRHNISSSETITKAVETIQQYAKQNLEQKLSIEVTGENYLNSKAVVYMVEGQFYSLLIILLAIFLVVSLLFMNPKAGMIAVSANLFPIIVLFGVMGALEIPMNTGTAMVAAISLGVCVDYTMHFMVRFNRVSKDVKNNELSLYQTAEHEAVPIMSTALALAAGFLTFSFSDFPPVARFGELSAMIMLLALVSTFVLTSLMLRHTRLITVWDIITKKLKDQVLLNSQLFSGMTKWQAKKLMAMTDIHEYQQDEVVILQGQPINNLFVLLEGEVESWRTRADGSSYNVGVNQPGAVFGMLFPDTGQKCFSDMVAIRQSKVLQLKWQDINQISRYFPRLSVKLHKNIAVIIASMLRYMDSRTIHSHDELSGAYGTVIFKELLETMTERAHRYHDDLTVISVRYINFDEINKEELNLINRTVGHVIQSNLRKPDIFGKWNEQCFWIACPNTRPEDAAVLKERIDSKLRILLNHSNVQIRIRLIRLFDNEAFVNFVHRLEVASGHTQETEYLP